MKISEQKAVLRAEVRTKVRAFSTSQARSASEMICRRVAEGAPWRGARNVLLFAPLAGEPDIAPLLPLALGTGIVAALPRFVPATNAYEAAIVTDPARDCVPGRYQTREPAPHCPVLPLNQLDLALVPGVAFDAVGRRIGRGKGYYDRLLAAVRGIKCGVAFDCQMIATIPDEPHDVRLNCLVTESRWLEFPPAPRF